MDSRRIHQLRHLSALQEQEDGLTKNVVLAMREAVEEKLFGIIQALKTMTESWKVAVTKLSQDIIHQAEVTYMWAVKHDVGSLHNDALSLR